MAATHKMVNGSRVALSAEEAAAIEFEWTANTPKPPRRAKATATLMAEISSLPPEDRDKLLVLMAAEWLRQHPTAARLHGVTLDGDQVDLAFDAQL